MPVDPTPPCVHEYDRRFQLLSDPSQYRCTKCGHPEFCHIVDGPPKVGSLWLHKSGERRFHLESRMPHSLSVVRVHYVAVRSGAWTMETVTLADWSAWERDAVRIDKEQA